MNQKGFTLMELLASIVIISVILMIVYPEITKISKKNNDDLYKTYENMMVEYARVSKYNNQEYIKLNKFEELEAIRKDNCKGYVKVTTNANDKREYKAFISCGTNGEKYQTTGYDATKE